VCVVCKYRNTPTVYLCKQAALVSLSSHFYIFPSARISSIVFDLGVRKNHLLLLFPSEPHPSRKHYSRTPYLKIPASLTLGNVADASDLADVCWNIAYYTKEVVAGVGDGLWNAGENTLKLIVRPDQALYGIGCTIGWLGVKVFENAVD